MRDLRAIAVTVQGALLVGLTLVLIQPSEIPDPFNVGPEYSWTVLCLIAGVPVLALAAARRLPGTRLDAFVWLYVVLTVVTLPYSYDRGLSGRWLLVLMANLVLFYGTVASTRVLPEVTAVMLTVMAVGVALLQLIAFEYHIELGLLNLIAVYARPQGWNGYPELGLLASVQLAILTAIFQMTPGLLARVAVLLVSAVTIVQLAFLYSRMAWVSAIALLLVASIPSRSKAMPWRWSVAAIAAAAVMLAVVVAIGATDIGRTLQARITERTAASERLVIWERTAQMVRDHPLAGVGMGNFQAVYEPVYNPTLNADNTRGGHAHNLWLQVAAEQGLPVAAAYVALWGAILTLGWRQRLGNWLQRAAFLIVVVMAVRSLGDYMFFSTGGAPARLHTLMWMTWGMIAAEPVPAAVKLR